MYLLRKAVVICIKYCEAYDFAIVLLTKRVHILDKRIIAIPLSLTSGASLLNSSHMPPVMSNLYLRQTMLAFRLIRLIKVAELFRLFLISFILVR